MLLEGAHSLGRQGVIFPVRHATAARQINHRKLPNVCDAAYGEFVPIAVIGLDNASARANRRSYTEADSGLLVASDANYIAGHVCLLGYRDECQMSIFSAISIASSTSMPR
jgi:hypothetical protein